MVPTISAIRVLKSELNSAIWLFASALLTVDEGEDLDELRSKSGFDIAPLTRKLQDFQTHLGKLDTSQPPAGGTDGD